VTNRAARIAAAMRTHQWVKNLLVAAPLVLAHQVRDPQKLLAVVVGIACFCLCASAVYVANDYFDIEHDRRHPTKRNRPFASGDLPLSLAPVMIVVLLLASFVPAVIFVPKPFAAWLGLYFILSTSYSMYFKRKLLVDVIVLAGLYTLRILAGGAAAQVDVSPWMLAFSIFMFLSLAFAKRFTELAALRDRSETELRGRGYMIEDLDIIQTVGPCSGYLAVLVFAMYIYSSELVTKLYHNPLLLWLLCPLMLYWITRVWFLARRRTLDEDPVLFAIRDRVSWYAAAIAVLLVLLASVKFPAF
jgi:4-hydroxybenzoate polyprenyltransferase